MEAKLELGRTKEEEIQKLKGGKISQSVAFTGTWCPFLRGAPPLKYASCPFALLVGTQQAHLCASSTSAVMVYCVFHVSYWGQQRHVCNHLAAVRQHWGDSDFCWFWVCVCVSITGRYHMQLSDPLAGSPKCQNGWHNIISCAGAGQIARFSFPTRGSLLQ